MKLRLRSAITLVLVILFAGACSDDSADATTTSVAAPTVTSSTTTLSSTTTTVLATTTSWVDAELEGNLATAEASLDAFFETYNSGDDQAVLALLTDDAALYVPFDDTPDEPERATWEQELAWSTAQGTVLRSPSCAVAEDQPESGTAVVCDYATLDAVTQAVNAPPVPTTTRFVVTSVGLISEIRGNFGTPDFAYAGEPFQRWLQANRPDVTCLPWYVDRSCDESRSVEEERAIGRMVAQYAQEFGTYLETNDCTFLDFAPGLPEPTCVES